MLEFIREEEEAFIFRRSRFFIIVGSERGRDIFFSFRGGNRREVGGKRSRREGKEGNEEGDEVVGGGEGRRGEEERE